MITRETLAESLHSRKVPQHLHAGLIAWVIGARRPGMFLRAVIENDMIGVVTYADPESLAAFGNIVLWFLHDAPVGSCRRGALKKWRGVAGGEEGTA